VRAGELTIGNEDGTTVVGHKGDVLSLKKGEMQEWSSEEGCHIFYVAMRKASD
jgi:ethanolamine utilization protein EutQ (cupin superfamily)